MLIAKNGSNGNQPLAALIMSQKVDQLLDWCDQHGISLLNIMILDSPLDSGITVIALDNLAHSDLGKL